MKWIVIILVLVRVSLNSVSSAVIPVCPECDCCDQGKTNCSVNKTECITCLDGYWGGKCRNECPTNCLACAKEAVYSGYGNFVNNINYHVCTKCADGWYLGDTNETMMCNLECPEGCQSCTSLLHCDECKSGRHSEFCNEPCSTNCQFENCSRENGNCIGGCKDQYSGDKCCVPNKNCIECSSETECVVCAGGFYGTDCQHSCPMNCLAGCSKLLGECNSCVKDTYGIFCNGNCSDTCSRNGGFTKCDKNSGECLFGCMDGFYGKTCQYVCETCRHKSCNRETGTCLTIWNVTGRSISVDEKTCRSDEQLAIAVVVTCLLTVFVIVALPSLVRFLKSRSAAKEMDEKENTQTKGQRVEAYKTLGLGLPDRMENYDTIESVTRGYANTNV